MFWMFSLDKDQLALIIVDEATNTSSDVKATNGFMLKHPLLLMFGTALNLAKTMPYLQETDSI